MINEEFNEAGITGALKTRWLGRRFHYYDSIGSTNDILKQLADQDEPYGTMIVADFQSLGKGRMTRRWEAPPGTSLLFSILFRPNWPAEKLNWLTMMGSLASAAAVESITNIEVKLKWPNDLMVWTESEWRKLGGLLTEGQIADGRLASAVLGIGINVNTLPDSMLATATSLRGVLNKSVSRIALLAATLRELENLYESADAGESPQPEWSRRLMTLGEEVHVRQGPDEGWIDGTAIGTDALGRLQVQDVSGTLHRFSAGDVTLRSKPLGG